MLLIEHSHAYLMKEACDGESDHYSYINYPGGGRYFLYPERKEEREKMYWLSLFW